MGQLLDSLRNLPDKSLGGTDTSFIDADTLKDESGELYRVRGINAAEVDKVVYDKDKKESVFKEGTAGGTKTTDIVHGLANDQGFTNMVPLLDGEGRPQKGHFGRQLVDLVNEEGVSFSDKLVEAGAFDINRYSTEQDIINRDIAEEEIARQKRTGTYNGSNAFDDAALSIKKAEAEGGAKLLGFKQAALDEQEMYQYKQQLIDTYGEAVGMERFHDMFTGDVQVRNADRNLDNSSNSPFSDSLEQGATNVIAGAYGVMNMLGETLGNEELAILGENGVIRKNAELANYGTTILDYKEVDSIGTAFQYLGNNLALSLPQMAVTAAAMATTPLWVGGAAAAGAGAAAVGIGTAAALTAPSALYAGQAWNEMEGEKSAAWAIGAGVAQATLDKLGLKIATKGISGDKLLKEAVKSEVKKGLSLKEAQLKVANLSRKEIGALTGSAVEHAKKQIKAKQLGRNLMKAVGTGGAGEGLTEAAQETIGYTAATQGSEKVWDWEDYNNRIISAAIAGGSLGGAISSSGTFYDAGAWADVAFRLGPEDVKKAANAQYYAERAKDKHPEGRVKSIQEGYHDAGKRAKNLTPTDVSARITEDTHKRKSRTVPEKIQDTALESPGLWRGAVRNIFTEDLKNRSPTAAFMADMFGGSLDKTHSGASFENEQHHRVQVYKNTVPEPTSFYQDILRKGKITRAMKAEVSKDFYDQWAAAVDKNGDFDPNLIKDGPRKQQIVKMGIETNNLAKRMHRDQKVHNKDLGEIKNYLHKYKSINKKAIVKNKTGFLKALESTGMNRNEASDMIDTILDNNRITDLSEAFSTINGGIDPASHQKRGLGMSEKAEFQEFMEQDMFANLSSAANSAARFTAHRDYLGKNGEVMAQMLDDMEDEGVPREQVNRVAAQMKDYLDAESGNYKRAQTDAGKQLQRYQKSFMMFSTLSALPLATISSLVETMLIHRGLRTDQIFGGAKQADGSKGKSSLKSTGEQLASTLWAGAKDVATLGNARDRALNNGQEVAKDLGFYEWDVGAATVTGATEVNAWQQDVYEGFFKVTGLTGFTNFTRAARAGIAADYINDKLETLSYYKNSGEPRTRELQEAEQQLRNLGVDIEAMTEIYDTVNGKLPLTPEQQALKDSTMREASFNFVNEAIVLPQAANRPLIYQDPRFALFTQFQGFIATFTANQIPKLWSEYVKRGTPAMKYNAFALATTMIMMGFASQYLKDLIKYGQKSPHLESADYIQRGVRASGLLGTSERILDQFFPLYEKNSDGAQEWAFNQIAGESAAISYGEKLASAAGSILQGDKQQSAYKLLRAAPLLGPATEFDKKASSWLTGGGWNYKGE